MTIINDGTGKQGLSAKVDSSFRLLTTTIARSLQNAISLDAQRAYQVIGTVSLASGTVIPMHIKNNSDTLNLSITYIRHQIIGATGAGTFPDVNNYFKLSLGRTRVSGGTIVTSINMNRGSNNQSQAIIYNDNPTLTGTAVEIDRWYTKANGDMNVFNKEGALTLAPGQSMELAYIGDQTTGIVYTRVSYVFEEEN